MNITIIGCGEVGYVYAKAILNTHYNLTLYTPRASANIVKFATENNIKLHTKLGEWLKESDVIFSCVPGKVTLSVLKETIPFLKTGSTFADFSSSAPRDKRDGALYATANGVSFVDIAIIGSVELNQAKTPLLCAGDKAEKIITIMKSIGAPLRELNGKKAGDAVALKLLRSTFMKGLSALTIECVVAAEYQGVKEFLYEILSDLDNTPLTEFLDMLIRNHVIHACRQCHEISEAKAQLEASGMPVQLLAAVEALFATTCDDTKSNPLKTKNPTTKEALAWLIETKLKKNT